MTRRNTSIALIAALAIASLSLIPTLAAANGTDSESTGASCDIVQSIALTKVADLDFGTVISSGVQGTISINASSGAQTDGGGAATYSAGNRAQFTVAGEPNYGYSVTYPATVELNDGGVNTMDAALTCSLAGDNGTLDGAGAGAFYLGGTLTVEAAQVSGAYTATFNVSVDYL